MSNGNLTNQNGNEDVHSGSGTTGGSRSGQPVPLPNNLWGFLGYCMRILGDFAKPLIIVAAIGFGIFMFIKEYQTRDAAIQNARNKTEELFQKRLSEAEVEKDRVYQEISQLSQRQIATVKELLDLQEKSGSYIEKEMQRFEGLRQKADEQVTRAEKAQKETDRLTVEAAALEERKDELTDELSKRQEQLNQKDRQLREKSVALDKRIEEITDWKSQYMTFVQEFLALADDPINTTDLTGTGVYKIASEIREEYFPENLSGSRIRWLREFAAHPDVSSIDTLQQLVGAKEEEIEKIVAEISGYETWSKYTIRYGQTEVEDEEHEMFYYVGFKERDDYGWLNAVIIQGGEGKVEDVEGSAWFSIVRLPSHTDWFARSYYIVENDFIEPRFLSLRNADFGKGGKWSFVDFITAVWSDESVSVTQELIYGKNKEFSFLPYEEFVKRDPNFYETVLDEEEDFAENAFMYEKSKRFDESSILFRDGVSLPPEVDKVFAKLLVGLVKNDKKIYASLLDRNINVGTLGKMAATALKKNFKVVDVIIPTETQRQMAIQSNAPGVAGEPARYNIFCEYQTSATDSQSKIALFSLARAMSGYGWFVVDFSEELRATAK